MLTETVPVPPQPPLDDELIDTLLEFEEGPGFEVKRVGDNRRKLETIVAMANSEGGLLVLGIEDPKKASGRDRVYGIEENTESVDELQRYLERLLFMAPDFLIPSVGKRRAQFC